MTQGTLIDLTPEERGTPGARPRPGQLVFYHLFLWRFSRQYLPSQ